MTEHGIAHLRDRSVDERPGPDRGRRSGRGDTLANAWEALRADCGV